MSPGRNVWIFALLQTFWEILVTPALDASIIQPEVKEW